MGQLFVLKEGEHIVGRSKDASIVVLDDGISRQHFKLIVKQKEVTVEDLSSTNGTYVNGIRVSKQILNDKDTLQISAETVMAFSYITDLEAQKQTQIYKMANFDPVTQARTKYYFLDQIAQEFAHAKRKDAMLSLVIFDIDFFKNINDTYGHPAGDYILKSIAELTQQTIRFEDLFARYGGEEFVILMRDTREKDAIQLAERLRHKISKHVFEFDGKKMKTSISAGVASLEKNNFSSHDEMIKAADQYLYFAKQNGRNRVASLGLLADSRK
ncbi:MAG: diguanylate cyclase [Deltaproteobacteria bacterium]|nr:diguanylate cyclase [Deltaproteobacteria bacterium]